MAILTQILTDGIKFVEPGRQSIHPIDYCVILGDGFKFSEDPVVTEDWPGGTPQMKYGGYIFSPCPLMAYARERVRDAENNKLFDRITLSFSGSILDLGGSFASLDVDKWKPLAAALQDGRELIIRHASGVFVSNVYPRVEGFSAEEGVWVNREKYSFDLVWEEQDTSLPGSGLVENISDSWQWSEADNDTATVSHSINAKGIDYRSTGGQSALNNAKDFVKSRLGTANIPATFPQKIFSAYNSKSYVRRLYSESVNKEEGSYSVSEEFIFASGLANNYIHRNSYQFQRDAGGIVSISVQGNIQGGGDSAFERAQLALSGWNTEKSLLYTAASGVYVELGGSKTLGLEPQTKSISRNKNSGVIDYTYSYSDKLEDAPEGIIDANYTISKTNPVPVYASIPIPGKSDGPVWQDVGTVTEGTYVLSGDVVAETLAQAISHAQTLINNHGGQSVGTDRRISAHSLNKDPRNNSVQFSVTWTFKDDSATSLLS